MKRRALSIPSVTAKRISTATPRKSWAGSVGMERACALRPDRERAERPYPAVTPVG
jgi:hypothetical protein